MPLKSSPIMVLYLKKKKDKTTIKFLNAGKVGTPERTLIDEVGKEKKYEVRTKTAVCDSHR